MKKKLYFLILLLFSLLIFNCSDSSDPIGKWGDVIKLSASNVEFGSGADSVTITTEGEWWWITDVKVNDETFYDSLEFSDSVPYIFSADCFVVERPDKQTLFIKLDENPLNEERKVIVNLEAGDYFDRVFVTQAAKK